MQRRLFLAELKRFIPEEGTVSRFEEGQILAVTAIALGDFEEHKTLVSPEYFKAHHVLVKLVHGLQVFNKDGDFAQSFDTAVRRVHGSSFTAAHGSAPVCCGLFVVAHDSAPFVVAHTSAPVRFGTR